jgi:beta-galactosidase
MQSDAIRKIIPSAKIGTNNYSRYDRYEVFLKLDFAGEDFYPSDNTKPSAAVFHTELYRGLIPGVNPWMLETPPAPGAPLNDLMRFYFWLFAGHGYDKIFYFLWTNHLAGNEKTHRTIMTQDGHPGLKYAMLRKLISEADSALEKYPELPLPQPRTALVYDYHASWIYTLSFVSEVTIFYELQSRTHEALFITGYAPEIISSEHDFSKYALVVLPIQAHISKDLASRLEKYVENGGTILINGRSGMYDKYSKNLQERGPEHLKKLLGLEIVESFEFAPQGTTPKLPADYVSTLEFEREHVVVTGAPGGRNTAGTIGHWAGGVKLTTAESVMTYKNSIFKGYPFLTVNKFGKGHALYYASDITDSALLADMVRYAESLSGLPKTGTPEGIDVSKRGNLMFVSNFNDFELSFKTEVRGKNIVGKALSDGEITIEGHGTALIELL